jgi:putative nucleotidyltransferase with HDIG domain
MLRTRVRAGAAAGLVLSLLFGGIFTVVSLFELYIPAFTPSFGRATLITLRVPYGPRIVRGDARGGHTQLSYEHARVIVPRGTVLDEGNDEHRAAFAYESIRRPPSVKRLFSFFVIDFIVCMMLTTYLRQFGQNRVRLLRPQVGLLALAVGSVCIAKGILLFTALPEFWIPMAALPVWVALAFDRRTAFLFELGIAFIAASLLRFDIVLLSVLLIRGIAASLFFFNRKHPRQMVVAGTLSGFAGVAAYVCLTIIFQGHLDPFGDLATGLSSNLIACAGGGAAAGLLAMIFREVAEQALGHVSRNKLLDLTDLEQPLLRKMAAEAPGSWEHARAMANLAEASSAAIGADALLTRVGAYYHDLGKTVQPKYFVENLAPGERSPHEELEPEVSADAIMAHVVMGTKILRQGGIPEPVVEFAYTHHGTQTVEYFWFKCKEAGNPKGLTQEHFRYPGMKPQTKETAILMLVDSIEAASRTIFPPDLKKFEEMIQRIIFTKLSGGQLDESGLTLEDLRVMTSRLASTLVNMYHGRIKYPWQREAERASAATPAPTSTTKLPATATPIPATIASATTPSPAPVAPANDAVTAGKPAAPESAAPVEPTPPTPRSPEAKVEPKTETKTEPKVDPKAEPAGPPSA